MCRGAGCREICTFAQRWCGNCWSRLPEDRRAPIVRCVVFLERHPEDPAAMSCLAAAVRDADRELAEKRTKKTLTKKRTKKPTKKKVEVAS